MSVIDTTVARTINTTNNTNNTDTTSARTLVPARVRTAARGGLLGVYRIVLGGLFTMHGLQGFGMFGGIDGKGAAVPLLTFPGGAATLLETVMGALVALGLAHRVAAVVCSGVMAYAYFTVHAPLALLPLANMGEPAALYAWSFLLLAVFGPGSFALGTLLRRRNGRRSAETEGDAV